MQNFTVPGSDVEVIKERHNMRVTQESIRQMLADGTPNWVKWPEDYRAFVRESFQASKEDSDEQVEKYKMENQDILTNAKARKVNAIDTREFIKKLRDNGLKCFTVDNNYPNTVALWAKRPFADEVIYVCYLQVPAMYEWSVLRLDRHNLPAGEEFRGWRTVLAQLIIKEIFTEQKAHEIFGSPTDGLVSYVYRQTLYNFRNRK